ncbi:MAG: murein biosynthesis integral membrane protein MurJ [Phycisphaerales bacterium]|nr:murein biosynthesis integral membrane protein MurJ [Phycisphaerales bacterium]
MSATSTTSPPDRFVGHANLMSALTILSRIAGLLRDKVCSYFIGVGNPVWGAFWMGFQLPNLFRRLFGEGALTAIFLPIYTRTLEEEGQVAASRLASATCTALVLLLGTITSVGELIAVPLAFLAQEPNNRLAAAMTAIMLPYCMMVCLVAILGAIATVHERFAQQALSPVILNIFWAAGAAVPVAVFGSSYDVQHRVYWIAGAILFAGLVQIALMLRPLSQSGVRLRPFWDLRHPGIREIIAAMLPILLGTSAVIINVYLDGQIAWWLSPDGHGNRDSFQFLSWTIHTPMGHGANGIFSVAQRIYLLPVGIFGVSLATALFPLMTKAANSNDIPELKRLIASGLRKSLFLSIPASFGMILIAKPLITLIYLGGKAVPDDIDRAAWATIFFCLGVWAFEMQMVLLRVFYALRDVRTPMRIALIMIVLNLALSLSLVWHLQEGGIALATTLAAVIQSAILLAILHKRLGLLGLRSIAAALGRSLLATTLMVAAGLLLLRIPLLWPPPDSRILTALVKLPLVVIACAGVYFVLMRLLKAPEIQDVPLLNRLFRKNSI